MIDAENKISDLVVALSEVLDGEFTILPADFYVAIMHPKLGLAAVIPDDRLEEAQRAAGDLTVKAATANVAFPAMHFGLSFKESISPWLVRYGPDFVADIVSLMTKRSAGRPVLGIDNIAKIIGEFVSSDAPAKEDANKEQLSPQLHLLTKKCIEQALGEAVPVVCGIEMDVDDLASPSFMLPALLICSALTWAIPVAAQKGKGGFLVKMAVDNDALLGYRVTGIDASAPILLFLPMIDLIRRATKDGECNLDTVLQRFADFLIINGMEAGTLQDVDVRVVSTT